MKTMALRHMFWILAVLVFVAGLILSVRSMRAIRTARADIAQRRSERVELEQQARELQRYLGARKAYEDIPGKRAVRLETLVSEVLEGGEADDIRESREAVVDAWVLQRKEVVLSDIALAKALTLIRKAEAQRPPWLLAECVLRASPLTPGRGRAVLTFDALERSSATSP